MLSRGLSSRVVALLAAAAGLAAAAAEPRRLAPASLAAHADFGSAATAYHGGAFVAVGAQNDRHETGTVWLYEPGNSTASLGSLAPSTLTAGANFGCALAACGTLLAVGAQYDGVEQAGSVYLYDVAAPRTPQLVNTIGGNIPSCYVES